MRARLPGWEFGASALAATVAGATLPATFYADGVAEIITVLGFLIAAFVPAMVLGATAIRAGGFSVLRIRALGASIERQIQIFGGLFFYALAACIVAVGGKLVKWSLTVPAVPAVGLKDSFSVNWLFPLVLTFLLIFLGLRSLSFVGGVLSILRLSIAIAEDEARARDREKYRAAADDLEAYQMPANYGSRVEPS